MEPGRLSLPRVLFITSLSLLVMSLIAGFALSQQWFWMGSALLIGCFWLFARKYPASWLASICLVATVAFIVVGKLIGMNPLLALISVCLTLAVWDLLTLDAETGDGSADEQVRSFEIHHIQSLGLVLGLAVLFTLGGRFMHLDLPFILLVVFVILIILGLDRVWGYLKKKR